MASSISESLQSSWARRERTLRLSAFRGSDSNSVTRERWAEEKKISGKTTKKHWEAHIQYTYSTLKSNYAIINVHKQRATYSLSGPSVSPVSRSQASGCDQLGLQGQVHSSSSPLPLYATAFSFSQGFYVFKCKLIGEEKQGRALKLSKSICCESSVFVMLITFSWWGLGLQGKEVIYSIRILTIQALVLWLRWGRAYLWCLWVTGTDAAQFFLQLGHYAL